MSTGGAIRFDDIGKRFGAGPQVLESVNLSVEEGEFVSFIGPSGCGKSTLLRMVSGLEEPTKGSVNVCGGTPASMRGRTAHIFLDATLLPWLNVGRNIETPLALHDVPATERATIVRRMLGLVRLEGVAGSYPRQLSGGMKMRVSVARALGQSPDVLLLDEPFGALDEITRNHLNEELLALRSHQEWTALFVTHSVAEAVFLSNRIVVMAASPGRIVGEVAVPFAYPRTSGLRDDPAYQALVVKVSRLLRSTEGGAQ
jgi:NitT/TauT family transport system ATP-binding protein